MDTGERAGVGSIDHDEALGSVGCVHQGWVVFGAVEQEQSVIPAASVGVMIAQLWVGSAQVKAEQPALAHGPEPVVVESGVEHLDEQCRGSWPCIGIRAAKLLQGCCTPGGATNAVAFGEQWLGGITGVGARNWWWTCVVASPIPCV